MYQYCQYQYPHYQYCQYQYFQLLVFSVSVSVYIYFVALAPNTYIINMFYIQSIYIFYGTHLYFYSSPPNIYALSYEKYL